MVKIVITGPESSGKTTLAQALSRHYATPWVPEYSRDYLNKLGHEYQEEDLLKIAQEQVKREDAAAQKQPRLLICDTSLIVIKVWSEYVYGRCHPWILQQIALRPIDLHLLCSPDIPWEPDPLRENPSDRDDLFQRYQQALQNQPTVVVRGDREERMAQARNAINPLFS